MEIQPYNEAHRVQIISVWERSVRATHSFLDPSDIEYFKQIVQEINFNAFSVHCLVNETKVIGFVGVADHSIEMLFLDPDFIGQGHGKKLIQFAMENLQANKVDVNEQNVNAVNFYSKYGFVAYYRTDKDPQGKHYPIIKMKLAV
jgi:putative acetyltransferase